jgi:hypothetical protein
MIAGFRCGNEKRVNKFWTKAEKKNCRLCGREEETIERTLIL